MATASASFRVLGNKLVFGEHYMTARALIFKVCELLSNEDIEYLKNMFSKPNTQCKELSTAWILIEKKIHHVIKIETKQTFDMTVSNDVWGFLMNVKTAVAKKYGATQC
jgi:hypothetical protein